MPVEGPLPQTGEQHDINADAVRCFSARMPRNWRAHSLEGTDDYGLDFQVQTTPGQRATDIFLVQLKGTRSPDISVDGEFLSIQLKASTIRFYDRIVEPILLVVCNLKPDVHPVDCPMYYVWIKDELRRVDVSRLPQDQQYLTLRVPTQNILNDLTDLSLDIDRQNELSRAGHALDVRVEQTHPDMLLQQRLRMVQAVTHGVASRGPAFMDALAAPTDEHWIAPLPGTLAWHLNQAKDLFRTNLLERISKELSAAEGMLQTATSLEVAEYWFLLGKLQVASNSNQPASDAFKRAHQTNPLAKYLAAWAETEVRMRYEDGQVGLYPDLLEALVGDDPLVLSARSRVLAAEGRFEESLGVADRIEGPARPVARALAHTIFSRSAEALVDCDAGLKLPELADNLKQILLVLRARAKFALAQKSAPAFQGNILPPSGVAGVDSSMIKESWEAIEKAVEALREAGWNSNTEYVADVWAATASILGKQKEVLPTLAQAARACPYQANLQSALESIAAQCGEFELALEANDRAPSSQMRNLRRTFLLHELGKHRACFQWFEASYQKFDRAHELFGSAVMVAVLSAQKMARPDLVSKWESELKSTPALRNEASLLEYFLALERNKLGSDEALEILLARYEELGRPFTLGVALLQQLNPTDAKRASTYIQVASVVSETVLLSPSMAVHLGLALVVTNQWAPLLELCKGFKLRIDAVPRMLAFEALALDRLGRTGEARKCLERLLAGGVLDALAMNTYVNIMVRCGYVLEAIEAAERIFETAATKPQRMECIRLLFNLIQNSDPASYRLLALAVEMGRMADPETEVEEGIYLMMFLAATLAESNTPSQQDGDEFRQRAELFFSKFPNSKIIKRGELREDASLDELVAQLKNLSGVTAERELFQTRLERRIQQGLTLAPFSLRPRLILSSVRDVVHLWEIAKVSSRDDRKYHLVMQTDTRWQPVPAGLLRERIPLLDWTALLVLADLGLIQSVVDFFGKIGIAKMTLEELAELTNPFSGSPLREKCIALQDLLKPHFDSIVQPSYFHATDEQDESFGAIGREQQEIAAICKGQSSVYRLYSDDVALRILCSEGNSPDGFCTLDVLAALESVGILSRDEVAQKLSKLCEWRVGIVVRVQEIISLLPDRLAHARSVREGAQFLDAEPAFMAVISALWDFRTPFDTMLTHASAVLRYLADETSLSNVALSALFSHWFVKAGMKADAPTQALAVLTGLIISSAGLSPVTPQIARKLWAVYRSLVEFHHGVYMDESKEREAIRFLGAECAKLQVSGAEEGERAYLCLKKELTEGASDASDFSSAYTNTLVKLRVQS